MTASTFVLNSGNEVCVLDTPEELAAAAARVLLDAARRRPTTGILLAGGSTPRRAYEIVAADGEPGAFGDVDLWYGDERMVPPDHPDSNHGMVSGAWLGSVTPPGPRVHRIRGELPSAATAAALVETDLRAIAGAAPELDLALLGIGADGHTASLFPGDPALDADALFVAALGGRRVTATVKLLTSARRVVFLVSGVAKAPAVAAAAVGRPKRDVPASLVAPAGRTLWLLDRGAAAGLALTTR